MTEMETAAAIRLAAEALGIKNQQPPFPIPSGKPSCSNNWSLPGIGNDVFLSILTMALMPDLNHMIAHSGIMIRGDYRHTRPHRTLQP